MKTNIECIRDVLLNFESLPLGCYAPYDFSFAIEKHGISDVEYSLVKLMEAGYISADIQRCLDGSYSYLGIYDITFPGHQFLEKIRDNKVWAKTKAVAGNIGSQAFDVIAKIATSILTNLISSKLGL